MRVVCMWKEGAKHSCYLWEEEEGTGIEDMGQREA